MIDITPEEKERLKRFSGDKQTIMSLKKLFLNVCLEKPKTDNTQMLASQRLAVEYMRSAFNELTLLNDLDSKETEESNPAV